MEVHPDMAWRLNQVLAYLHPAAIPSQFRKKPVKQPKEHHLVTEQIPFKVRDELSRARGHRNDLTRIWFTPEDAKLSTEAKQVLQYLGGVPEGNSGWAFDYPVGAVLNEMQRTGCLPEQKSHQYFPTQQPMAIEAVERADIGEDDTVLEPEAGMGGIADYLPKDRTTCVEISALHCKVLESKGFKTICTDFLQWSPQQKFDRIVMNPPFSERRDIAHLQHAVTLLSERGRLVAILPAGHRNKTLIESWKHEWSEVFTDQFQGTGVSVAILVLTRPVNNATLF
ncbi:MAG TPA: restriction endonuclease subunit M, partial [Noviherbaspirillum sp.]